MRVDNHRLKCFLALLFLLLLPGVNASAQMPYSFKHFQVENGLSHSKVEAIEMDSKGFMWFGTIDGLNRFDGYNFKVFRKDLTNPKSLKHHVIVSLLSDTKDRLWVGTDGGLYMFDMVKETFRFLPFTKYARVRSIKKDLKGNLWIVLNNSLCRLDARTNKFFRYDNQKILATSVCILQDGTVYASTADGTLERYISSTDSFESFDVFSGKQNHPAYFRTIEKIYDTKNGVILIGTVNAGIKAFDLKTHLFRDIITENSDGTKVCGLDFIQFQGNEYWMATETGIISYNMQTNKLLNIQMEYDNPFSLSDNTVYSMFKDKEGGIWAGTRFGGVNYRPYPFANFMKYFSMARAKSLKGNGVHEICPDGYGNLWIGTEQNGLNKLNIRTQQFTHYQPSRAKGSISFSNIHGLLADGRYLWIGTLFNGLDKMDIKSGKVVKNYTLERNLQVGNFIIALFKTRSGDLYAGSFYHLYKYNEASDSFVAIPGLTFLCNSIAEISPGILSICTLNSGVYIYDTKSSKVIENLRYDPKDENSLPDDAVSAQHQDRKGNFWYATREGLSRYEPSTKRFKTYTVKQGLPSNFVLKILEDKFGNLWISSTKGLICFNPLTERVKVFTTASGLINDQFNINSACQDSMGNMYFGSVNGLISFNPNNINTNEFIPPVRITGLQVNNKELCVDSLLPLKNSLPYTEKLVLNYNQSSISIDFAALSYNSTASNEYAYKMEGLDKDWTYLKHNRKVYFTQLPPGKYIFRVKGSNNSGIWNDAPTNLAIEISPPFWASSLAYTAYIFLLIGSAAFGVKSYNKSISRKNDQKMEYIKHEREKELYQNKIDFFTNIAHEIRTPLTLIRGPMENIMDHADELPAIRKSLQIMERSTNQLVDLTNQLLDFRQTEEHNFSLEMRIVDVVKLLKMTHNSFQSLKLEKKLECQLEIPMTELKAWIDEDALVKILNNLYSNAFKYADKFIKIRLIPDTRKNVFCIEFRNDGFSIPIESNEKIFEPFFRLMETSSQPGTGIGLTISRNLAELHKGTLKFTREKSHENIFLLTLPIDNITLAQK